MPATCMYYEILGEGFLYLPKAHSERIVDEPEVDSDLRLGELTIYRHYASNRLASANSALRRLDTTRPVVILPITPTIYNRTL